jgi:hypothetical protein
VVFFFLWGNGGPNFIHEFRQWETEEQRSWSVVKASAHTNDRFLSGANAVPLGSANKAVQQPSPASRTAMDQFSFLRRLNDWEKDDLEAVISAGYDYAQILQCFRFDHKDQPLNSPLDSFSPRDLQELCSLIARKLTDEQLAVVFGTYRNSDAPHSSIPASSVFNIVHAALASSSGNPRDHSLKPSTIVEQAVQEQKPIAQQPTVRISAFDRLQFPAQQPEPRVSAFQRLQEPIAPQPLNGPQHNQPTAVMTQSEERTRQSTQSGREQARPTSGPVCPRCLTFGHLCRHCWKKIKCHSCNKEGHVKVDCHFYPDSGLNTRWV